MPRLLGYLRRRKKTKTPPKASPDALWEEAFARVESYLCAHHVRSRMRLSQLTAEILEEAKARITARSDASPVELAMEVTRERSEAWFAQVLNCEETSVERLRLRGRLALAMADAAGLEASRKFLDDAAITAELAKRLRGAEVEPGPALTLRKMAPAPLEFPFGQEPATRWLPIDRPVLYRAAAVWVGILALMGAAWASSH